MGLKEILIQNTFLSFHIIYFILSEKEKKYLVRM